MADEERVDCPVDGCTGLAYDHEEDDNSQNLHTRASREFPFPTTVEWPLEVNIFMSAKSWPEWRLDIEVWNGSEEITPLQAAYMSAELFLNSTYVAELNKAIKEAS